MMSLSRKFDFVVQKWKGWIPEYAGLNELKDLPSIQNVARSATAAIPSKVPKFLQRRLSPLAKAVFYAADSCLENNSTPIVFSSAHGEVNKSLDMLRDMQRGEGISPTAFSLSVHNAISGLFSIAYNNHQEITVLAPGQDGIAMAFIEALGILEEQQKKAGPKEVIIVLYDEPLSDFYPSLAVALNAPTSCALALKISLEGDGIPLQLQRSTAYRDDIGEHAIQIFSFLKFLVSKDTFLQLGNHRRSWIWHKK